MPTLKYGSDGSYERLDVYGIAAARRVATLADFTATNPANTIAEARAMVVTLGGPLINAGHPSDGTCVLVSRTVSRADGTVYAVIDDYERPSGFTATQGTTNSLYVIAEDRTTVTVERVKFPHVNGGEPIYVGWENPTDPLQKIPPQLARFRIQKPALSITIAGTFDMKPSYTDGVDAKLIGAAQGKVNATTFKGLEPGYWLFAGCRVRRNPKQARRYFEAVLVSMLDEDWSEYAIVEHPSGLVPELDITSLGTGYPDDTENYLKSTTEATREAAGIVQIGPYPGEDFTKVFAAIDSEGE